MILAAAAALATSWAQVAPSEQAALARTPDGAVHVAWASGGQLYYGNPATGATVPIAAGPDVRPAFVADASGLRVFAGGVSASSADGGTTWQVGANAATGEVSADGDLLAWTDGNRVRVGGFDYGLGAFPALAPGMLAWDAGDQGVRVQGIGADGERAGEASTMPDSAGQGRPSIVARAGGGWVVSVGSKVWRVGASSTLSVYGWAAALAADARGRVWVTWTDDQRVYAARSDRDVSQLGAAVDLGPFSAERLAVSATNTAAHVLAAANGVSSLRRVLPGLALDERHRREIFTFSVTDAGDPVRGAVVKVGRRSGKTDRNGRVTLRVSDRRLRVTATLKGYSNARLTLK